MLGLTSVLRHPDPGPKAVCYLASKSALPALAREPPERNLLAYGPQFPFEITNSRTHRFPRTSADRANVSRENESGAARQVESLQKERFQPALPPSKGFMGW